MGALASALAGPPGAAAWTPPAWGGARQAAAATAPRPGRQARLGLLLVDAAPASHHSAPSVGGAAACATACATLCGAARRRSRRALRGAGRTGCTGRGAKKRKGEKSPEVDPEVQRRREERRFQRESHIGDSGPEDGGQEELRRWYADAGFDAPPDVGRPQDPNWRREEKLKPLPPRPIGWSDDPERYGYDKDGQPLPEKKKQRAAWKEANRELRLDPSYAQQWEFNPASAKFREDSKSNRRFKPKQGDRLEELDKEAAELRSLYHRPRFSWKGIHGDDLSTAKLSPNLPAIGFHEVWLSKFLSHSGACSRRDATEMVLQGRVMINGVTVQEVQTKVNPKHDCVTVDGVKQNLRTLGELLWIMLYKPKGCISTVEDPMGRKTIMDCVPFARQRRLVPIGRIDRNASGLLLLTNDYEWHTILSHPRYSHGKRYKVEVYGGTPNHEKMRALREGMQLPDEKYQLNPVEEIQVTRVDEQSDVCEMRLTLTQGVYRQLRRMFEYLGHPVKSIKRTDIGFLPLDKKLQPGEWRVLTSKEIRRLKGSTIQKKPQVPLHVLEQREKTGKKDPLNDLEAEPERSAKKMDRLKHLDEMQALMRGHSLPDFESYDDAEDEFAEPTRTPRRNKRKISKAVPGQPQALLGQAAADSEPGEQSSRTTQQLNRRKRQKLKKRMGLADPEAKPQRASLEDLRMLQSAFDAEGSLGGGAQAGFAGVGRLAADPAASSRLEQASVSADDTGDWDSDVEQDWIAQLDRLESQSEQSDLARDTGFNVVSEDVDEWEEDWAQQLDAAKAERAAANPRGEARPSRRRAPGAASDRLRPAAKAKPDAAPAQLTSEKKGKMLGFLAAMKEPVKQ